MEIEQLFLSIDLLFDPESQPLVWLLPNNALADVQHQIKDYLIDRLVVVLGAVIEIGPLMFPFDFKRKEWKAVVLQEKQVTISQLIQANAKLSEPYPVRLDLVLRSPSLYLRTKQRKPPVSVVGIAPADTLQAFHPWLDHMTVTLSEDSSLLIASTPIPVLK